MDINQQISHNVGHCLLCGSNWELREEPYTFGEVVSVFFSCFESYLRMIGQRSTYWSMAGRTFEWGSGSFWVYRQPFTWNFNWQLSVKLLDDSQNAIDPRGLRNRVAFFEKPYTMHGTHHSAWFRCIHEQCGCKRMYQVLRCPWAWSAIWRD